MSHQDKEWDKFIDMEEKLQERRIREAERRKDRAITWLTLMINQLITTMIEKKVISQQEAYDFISKINLTVFTEKELDDMGPL